MIKRRDVGIFSILIVLVLGGCATIPTGPSVMALPAEEKSFEQFQADDTICKQWAAQQIGLSPQDTVNQNTAAGAVVGAAVGAGLGAVIGSASGNTGAGAAIGAASGLLVGMASGADEGQVYGGHAQRRYDNAYLQCMYAKGNQIPGGVTRTRRVRRIAPPPPPEMDSIPPDYAPPYPPPPEQ